MNKSNKLHNAANEGPSAIALLIEELPEQDVQRLLSEKDSDGNTPLHLAARNNHNSLKFLIEKFPKKAENLLSEKDSDGRTLLHLAAQFSTPSLEFLIEKFHTKVKSLLSKKDSNDDTPLHLAAMYNEGSKVLIEKFPEKVESLLSEGNGDGSTPLHLAAQFSTPSLKLLIEKFSEKVKGLLDDKDSDGDTPLHLAARSNHNSLKLLIEKFSEKVKGLLCDKDSDGDTPLHLAAKFNDDSLKLLIEKFPEKIESMLGDKDSEGNTPLHLAAKWNEYSLKLLIEKFPEKVKCLLSEENSDGNTLLNLAENFNEDSLELLKAMCPEASCIKGNEEHITMPGLPEAFSSYYQDQVAFLLQLRLEDAMPGVLKSVNVLEENYTLRKSNEDDIATKLSSFILTSEKDIMLIPLNVGGSHLVGIAVVRDGNKVMLHYMDSELNPPPESLIMQIGVMLESHGCYMELIKVEVEEQKYSNCGPEVIENFTYFVTGKQRASQEEAVLKHSMVLEKHLLKDLDGIAHIDDSVNVTSRSAAIFNSASIIDQKLIAQVQHYLNTGALFDTARSAIETGTISIINQPFYDEVVTGTVQPLSLTHTYNEELYNDSPEVLYHTADINIVTIVGLLCSFSS